MLYVGTAGITCVQKWTQRTGVSDWIMPTLTYMEPPEHPNQHCSLRYVKHWDMMTHAMRQTGVKLVSSCPTYSLPTLDPTLWLSFSWPPEIFSLMFTKPVDHITHHTSHRCATPPNFANALSKVAPPKLSFSVGGSFRASSLALNSADVAADLHSVNSSFIPLKSRVLGSDYAGSQTPCLRFVSESFYWVESSKWIICTKDDSQWDEKSSGEWVNTLWRNFIFDRSS